MATLAASSIDSYLLWQILSSLSVDGCKMKDDR